MNYLILFKFFEIYFSFSIFFLQFQESGPSRSEQSSWIRRSVMSLLKFIGPNSSNNEQQCTDNNSKKTQGYVQIGLQRLFINMKFPALQLQDSRRCQIAQTTAVHKHTSSVPKLVEQNETSVRKRLKIEAFPFGFLNLNQVLD